MRGSAGRQVINQFLAELDGVKDSNDGLLILAATNAPWSLDSAFPPTGPVRPRALRPAPRRPPAPRASSACCCRASPRTPSTSTPSPKSAKASAAPTSRPSSNQAIEAKLADAVKTGVPAPLTTRDLLRSVKQVKPSTLEWFATAKNHALYANEGGQYDDILDYLKMR